jgi:uridine phosphorylase
MCKFVLVANRIITVGAHDRAAAVSSWFDEPEKVIHVKSKRMFETYTGLYKGVPISVVATGMVRSSIAF